MPDPAVGPPFNTDRLIAAISDLWDNIGSEARDLHLSTVEVCRWVHQQEWHADEQ